MFEDFLKRVAGRGKKRKSTKEREKEADIVRKRDYSGAHAVEHLCLNTYEYSCTNVYIHMYV